MGKKIYGCDIEGEITPIKVRDALIECFVKAHDEILEELRHEDVNKEEFEEIKRMDVKLLMEKMFEDVGASFEKPTKETILLVIDKLKEFSKHFRKPEIIACHEKEIKELIEKL